MDTHSISCIILAGGEGKRVNHADKGLLLLNNQPLISHVINALQAQVDDIVISANRNLDQYKKFSSTVVCDDNGQHGPLSGIASALPACKHDRVLIVPCDMPYLPYNLVAKLLAHFDHHDMAIVEIDNRLQLVLMIKKSLLTSVQNQIASGQYKLMHWVKSCSTEIVDFNQAADAFKNINNARQINNN